jgi:hypothetical protein
LFASQTGSLACTAPTKTMPIDAMVIEYFTDNS